MFRFLILSFFTFLSFHLEAEYNPKIRYVDALGNPVKFDPVIPFASNYTLCKCNVWWDIQNECQEILKQDLELLYYAFDPPFTWSGEPYNWESPYVYWDRVRLFYREYFTRNPHAWGVPNCIYRYSEFAERCNYLYYWLEISCEAEIKNQKEYIKESEEQINKAKKDRDTQEYIDYLEKELLIKNRILNELPSRYATSAQALASHFELVTDMFLVKYSNCLTLHKDPLSLYERGKIAMDRGQPLKLVQDIFSLVELDYEPTIEMNVELAKAYNDANLYHQAIKTLSEVLRKNPDLKEAYFERAVAYFETGNLQLALSDYLLSGQRPQILDGIHNHQFVFSLGLGLGCAKGGIDSATEFVPTLFSSMYGLGKGIWAFAADPIGISKEMVEGIISTVAYLKNNLTPELLAELVPELKECIQKWDQLEEEKKGYYIGYVIGKYSVDALICGSTLKAVQLYRNLKKANTILALETALTSPNNAEALFEASQEFFKSRSKYKQKCKLHLGHQEKHIRGANNFLEGRSELTISVERLEKISATKLGDGVPSRFTFGEAAYKELVEFDEIIGVHVSNKTGIKTPTSVGEIHYKLDGSYHVVPVHPNKIHKFLKEGKK